MKIHSGDKVKIISGKDRSKTGTVEKAYPKKGKVLVPGIHVVKKHVPPTEDKPEGGYIEKSLPIDVSNVMLICSNCGEPTRVGFSFEGGRKLRKCKKCGSMLS
ncbi:MAG: 50S ribosomal protein L24 [Patescibacteria group bacterium]|nr:50S ribosomal protein L24 [Patescibacteria group bacterium]